MINTAVATLLLTGPVLAGECNNVAHVADASVAHRAESVDVTPSFQVDASQLDVPVVVDVLRQPGGSRLLSGEVLVGTVTTDGRSATFQGPAVNGGQAVVLGPDCKPLEPQQMPVGDQSGRDGASRR